MTGMLFRVQSVVHSFSFVAEDSLTRDAPKEEETLPPPDDRDQPDLLKEDVDEDTSETTPSSGEYDASSEASSSDDTMESEETTSSSKKSSFLDRARARGRSCKNIFIGFVCAVIVKKFVNNFVLL